MMNSSVDDIITSSELCCLDRKSRTYRKTIVKMMQAGGRGHMASAFSMIEIISVLYDHVLKYDASNPKSSDRDRFILSKGHGCMALYAILQDKGFFPEDELWRFCHHNGILGGHPEISIPGIEASTGSLGHGLSIGVGMAIGARHDRLNHKIYVLIGDGESNEGSIWEAALAAGKHKLDNLVAITDYNKQQSYSTTYEVQDLEPLGAKWESFGFAVRHVNGHDREQLKSVFEEVPLTRGKPQMII